jgi:hypothetical protein
LLTCAQASSHRDPSNAHADGSLLYELSFVGVESGFARAWGVGLGLDQAYQWRHVARQCALSLASLFLLEALLFGSSGFNDAPWFEAHVEAASVHATLARAPGE